ncbi:hypothetical protein CDD83_182 [Cordyceps sp. RAO-2017]|nr:hypothetical protein CDD83_182 [Cordyceps sp. RAO-2017]
MPSDDYAAAVGGALRIKGGKVQKKKKKAKKGSDPDPKLAAEQPPPEDDGDQEPAQAHKTETERRFEEVKKKRLLQMSQASGARSDLLKTHKERVEELNTYLSKLSEHHDMPKIGPG